MSCDPWVFSRQTGLVFHLFIFKNESKGQDDSGHMLGVFPVTRNCFGLVIHLSSTIEEENLKMCVNGKCSFKNNSEP